MTTQWNDTEAFFDWPTLAPLPSPACARVGALDQDLPLGSPAFAAVARLAALARKAFRGPLTEAWLAIAQAEYVGREHEDLKLFLIASEYDFFDTYDAADAWLLRPTQCVNLAVIARGLHAMLLARQAKDGDDALRQEADALARSLELL